MGGSNDTELNEFAVSPALQPSASKVVTTVMPVPKHPRALRSSLELVDRHRPLNPFCLHSFIVLLY